MDLLVVLYAGCHGELHRRSLRDSERTLKIKQCKTRTKTHKIPVNSYSVLRRIRKQEIVFKLRRQ